MTLNGDLETQFGTNVGTHGGIGELTTTGTVETFEGAGFTVGTGTGSQGIINVNVGGSLSPDLPGFLNVGENSGTGTVNIHGGTATQVMATIGFGGTGTIAVTDKGSLSTESENGVAVGMVVGENEGNIAGVGTVTCDNSFITADNGISLGQGLGGASATGTATLTNAGNVFVDDALDVGVGVGVGGNGTVSVLSGSALNGLMTTVVGANGGNGSVLVSGAKSTFGSTDTGKTFVGEDSSGNAGTGTFQVDTQGTAILGDTLTVVSGGTLNVLSGGTLSAPSINLSAAGSVNLTGGTIDLTGGTFTDAALTLPNTTTLEGTGSFTGNLSSFGSVSPGDAPGILTIDDNYIQDSSGALDIGIGGTTLGTKYDQLKVLGSTSLSGSLDITLLNGFVPAIGNQFDILSLGSETGSFTLLELPALPAGRTWDTSQLYTTGVISVVVPEPVSGAMLIAAGIGLASRRRRKA